MDPYDSDSSLSDADAGTSTDVLLGYASTTATDDSFSQLGGEPTWLELSQHPSPTFIRCKVCNGFLSLLLQLNGDLPDRFAGHERRLYIWACRRKACRRKPGSIRATRGVKTSEAQKRVAVGSRAANAAQRAVEEVSRPDIGSALFGGQPNTADGSNHFASNASTSNPFSSASSSNPFSSTSTSNPFSTTPAPVSELPAKPPQNLSNESANPIDNLRSTFAAKASISTPAPSGSPPPTPRPAHSQLPWPESSQLPKPYRSYHLDADYEYLSEVPTNRPNAQYAALMDIDGTSASQSSSGKGGANEKEDVQLYESEHDQAFQHFADILAQNPEQSLRYEFGGSPLLYSRSDLVGRIFAPLKHDSSSKITTAGPAAPPKIPKCENCGAPRTFEIQLMPHAIAELEADEDVARLLDEGMEWGTIIVGVCSKDCGSGDGGLEYLEEWVGVQWEEVVSRAKGKGAG